MTEPSFTYNKDGSLLSAVGFEAVDCYRVACLISAIKMMRTTRIIPTRGFTMKKGLLMAKKLYRPNLQANRG